MTAAATERSGDSSFVHLHVHTEYSMLDGAARLKDMFAQCEREGMSAVAMTDHGNLYGAYDFWSKGTKAGIKPIIGIEAYVAPEHRRHRQPVRWGTPAQKDDDVSGAGAYTHSDGLAFLRTYGISYPNVVDSTGATAINYGVSAVPETFFLNRQGIIVSKVIGEVTEQSLQSNVHLLL